MCRAAMPPTGPSASGWGSDMKLTRRGEIVVILAFLAILGFVGWVEGLDTHVIP